MEIALSVLNGPEKQDIAIFRFSGDKIQKKNVTSGIASVGGREKDLSDLTGTEIRVFECSHEI